LSAVKAAFYTDPAVPPSDARDIDVTIRKILELDPSTIDRSYVLLGLDDKGIVDVVTLSFQTLGFRLERVLYFYFGLLAVSCAVFVLAFFRRPLLLLLLVTFLVMDWLTLPALSANPQLVSVLGLRVAPVLTMVACLHCVLFVLGPRPSVLAMALVGIQAVLITFGTHLRSVAAWQVMTITVLAGAVVLVRWRRRHGQAGNVWNWRHPVVLTCWPVLLVLGGQLFLAGYRARAFPAEYQRGEQILTRVFWHNIFSGLAFQPELAQRYSLRIDDISIIRATGQYLQETGRAQEWIDLGGTSPQYSSIRWTPYDLAVRDMLFDRCKAYPAQCLSAVVYYKPLSLLGDLAWVSGLRPLPPDLEVFTSSDLGDIVKDQAIEASRRLDETGSRAYLWTPGALVGILVLALVVSYAGQMDVSLAWSATGALLAGSLIPTAAGYPSPHTFAEPAIAAGMLVYLSLTSGTALLMYRLRRRE
jgi:hypothetical protein